MGFDSRQQIVKLAVASVVLATGVLSVGCGRGGGASSEDKKAAEAMDRGDYQAAAKEKQASPHILAHVASVAASEQYAATVPQFRKLTDQQMEVYQTLWQLDRLAGRVQATAASAKALVNYNPEPSLTAVDRQAEQIKGQNAAVWSPADSEVSIPTISAATAELNQLKDQKTEIERTLADLKQKRDAVAQQARDLFQQADAQKGQQAVDLYTQASNTKKQAADLDVQVAQVEASLVPMDQQIVVAENRIAVLSTSVEALEQMKAELETGWRRVNEQASGLNAQAAAVYGSANAGTDASTVLARSSQLGDQLEDYRKEAAAYDSALQAALATAKDASTAAGNAHKAVAVQLSSIPLKEKRGAQAQALEALQRTIDPAGTRFMEGVIGVAAGHNEGNQAAVYAAKAKLAEQVALAAATVGQPEPANMKAADARLKLEEAAQRSQTAFQNAISAFDMTAGHLASEPMKKAGLVGQINALYGYAMVSQDRGNQAEVTATMETIQALREKLGEGSYPLAPGLPAAPAGGAGAAPVERP